MNREGLKSKLRETRLPVTGIVLEEATELINLLNNLPSGVVEADIGPACSRVVQLSDPESYPDVPALRCGQQFNVALGISERCSGREGGGGGCLDSVARALLLDNYE